MSKGSWPFRKTDVRRVIQAAQKEKLRIERVEIEPGERGENGECIRPAKIVLIPFSGASQGVATANEWDGAE